MSNPTAPDPTNNPAPAPSGFWFTFHDGQLQPSDDPRWSLAPGDSDWTTTLAREGYTTIQDEIGCIAESFFGLDVYHRGDHKAGHEWLCAVTACAWNFYVQVKGFPDYVDFLRWIAGPLQISALESLKMLLKETRP
jgi:hypothetical protein